MAAKEAETQNAKKILEKYKSFAIEDIEAFGEDAWFGYCPTCGELQSTLWNEKYCGNCGQVLDWRNEEVTDVENNSTCILHLVTRTICTSRLYFRLL